MLRPLSRQIHRKDRNLFGALSADSSEIDRLRFKQEDPPYDAFRPQGFPRPQPQRCRTPPHAQPNIRRRDRPLSLIKKESRDQR